MKLDIAPSILAADVMDMKKDIERVIAAGADSLHVDIMDGHFVPNISYGPSLVKALRKAFPERNLDVHLMLTKPSQYIDAFIDVGSDEITIHVEVEEDIADVLMRIKARNVKCGLSVKPKSDVSLLKPYLHLLDQVLVMTVEPGFGGQKLMPDCLKKIPELRALGFRGILSVDGGVGKENAKDVLAFGANRLVMGTSLFYSENPKEMIETVRSYVG